MVQSGEQLPLVQQVVVLNPRTYGLDSFITQPFSLMCKRLDEKDWFFLTTQW